MIAEGKIVAEKIVELIGLIFPRPKDNPYDNPRACTQILNYISTIKIRDSFPNEVFSVRGRHSSTMKIERGSRMTGHDTVGAKWKREVAIPDRNNHFTETLYI